MFNSSTKIKIITKNILLNDYYKIITKYYQPFLGRSASLLYLNCLVQLENKNETNEQSITVLQSYLNTSVSGIFNACRLLHQVGLVNLYKSKIDNSYIVEVIRPKVYEEFFADMQLSKSLLEHVGEEVFETLKNEITTIPFNLTSFEPVGKISSQSNVVNNKDKSYYDFITKFGYTNSEAELKEIALIASANRLTKNEIIIILNKTVTNKQINFEGFKTEVSKIRVKETMKMEEIKTEADFIRVCSNLSSEVFLQKVSNGRTLSTAEQKLITELREKYQLNDSVINVLIDYTLLTNDKMLNRNFILSVAATWSRKNISTAEEAIKYVKAFQNRKDKTNYKIEPDWVDKSHEEKNDDTLDDNIFSSIERELL